METDCQRFDQSAFQRRHLIRQQICHIFSVAERFPQHAVHRRGCEKYHIRAEVIAACLAELTVSAGLARLQCHPVPHFQMLHVLSDLYHGTARLVSKYKGRLYHIVPDGSGLIIVEVTAADPHIFQLHKHLIVLRFRNLPFLKSHLTDPQHYRSFHCSFHDDFLLFISLLYTLLNSFIMFLILYPNTEFVNRL